MSSRMWVGLGIVGMVLLGYAIWHEVRLMTDLPGTPSTHGAPQDPAPAAEPTASDHPPTAG